MALLSEPSNALRSFDVNWRSALWPQEPPSDLFAEAANRADVVFVGLDEAEAVWGFSSPSQVRALLSEPGVVVVKDGGIGVHVFTSSSVHFEPAMKGPILGPRGAGDAFAAGFLASWLNGGLTSGPADDLGGLTDSDSIRRCSRLGHVVAMSAMVSESDVGPLPDEDSIKAWLSADPPTWSQLSYRTQEL